MAALGSQSIASSYEQLLHVDRDDGGNSTTHVSVKDGDNGTTFGFTIASDALMMSSTNRLEFGDTGTYIHQSADGVLDLVSDTEIEINATTIDMNGAADLSGNLTVGGDIDLEGSIDVNATANLDNTDIDGTLAVDGTTISLDATTSLNIDNSNTSNGITIGTATSGVPISIGHSTSETTVNDNLNVTGILDVTDTTDSSDATGDTGALRTEGGASIAKKLYVGTDLDVDGTANLDVVDIDGAVDMASTLAVNSTTTIKKALSSDTQSTPETVLKLGTTYTNTSGTDGAAGSGTRIEFEIPDDDTNPITGSAIAGLKENGDDGVSNSALVFYVSQDDTTLDEAMRIESDGTVTTQGAFQPAGNITCAGDVTVNGGDVTISNSGGHANLNIDAHSNEGSDSAIAFRSGTTERGYIYYDHNTTAASQAMVFNTGDNAVTAMKIMGDGSLDLLKGQIKFPATINASSDANTLDDYEEGIHTTAITGGTSGSFTLESSNQSLAYTKIGRMVTVQGKFQTSSGSGSGHLKISMPFTANNSLDDNADVSVGSITINRYGSTSIATQMTPIIFANTAYVNIQLHNTGNANETYLQADNVDATIEGQICISYIV